MHPETIHEIETEIALLRRRHAAFLREAPEALEVDTRWTTGATSLRWIVLLPDVIETDIDVEITREVLIVRASRSAPDPAVLVGILPVPHGFDPEHPAIRFTRHTLEVRVRRVRSRVVR